MIIKDSQAQVLLAKLIRVLLVAALMTMFTVLLADARESGGQLMDAEALAEKYVKFLEEHASWDPGEMEVQNVRINPRKIWLPKGNVSFRIEGGPGGAVTGRVSSMVTILVDGRPVRRARACANIEVYKPVLCAARGLKRGQVITARDLSMSTMPLSKLKTGYFQEADEVIGMAARRTLRPGHVITSDVLARPVVVKRGSRVMIVAESPSITVKVPGQVVEKGAVGDFVRVKNLGSRRVIVAQVADSNTVKVNF